MTYEPIFKECDTCAAKAGSPILCNGCLHNRALINNLLSRPLPESEGDKFRNGVLTERERIKRWVDNHTWNADEDGTVFADDLLDFLNPNKHDH